MSKPTDNTKISDSHMQSDILLYKNIDILFFESIVSGPLRPFLPIYDFPEEVQKLTTVTVQGKFEIEELVLWHKNGSIPKDVLEKFNVIEGDNISFKISDFNTLYITFSKSEELLYSVFDIEVPDPPNEKAKAFLHLIRIEYDLMKLKAQKVLKFSESGKQLSLYANKNIQCLKDIASRADKIFNKLIQKSPDLNANNYVYYILREFIVQAIMFYQDLFQPFLNYKKEEYQCLRTSLYSNHTHLFKIPLPEDPVNNNSCEKVSSSTVINSYTYKHYNNNLPALTDLLNILKNKKLVATDTILIDFRKIFNNEIPSKPIKWSGHFSELYYFIKLLHNDFKIITDLKANIWKITSRLFIDCRGRHFDWKKFRCQKNPSKAEAIEKFTTLLYR